MKIPSILLLLFLLSISFLGQSQEDKKPFFPKYKISTKKYGVIIGLNRGEFTAFELGGETQFKRVKLTNPITHAANFSFDYNFKQNTLGLNVGYWFKTARLGLTYGARGRYMSDFTEDYLAISPMLGFKFSILHLQVGYNYYPTTPNFNHNKLFVSLRVVLINNSDTKFKKKEGSRFEGIFNKKK